MSLPDHTVFDEKPAADLGEDAVRHCTWVKPAILLSVIAAGLLIVAFSPLKTHLRRVEDIRAWLEPFGYAGPLIYMAGVFVLIALGFPRLLFCPVGGVLFGWSWGLVWTQLPTLIGYYALFLFVRWGGRDFVLRRWPRLQRMHKVFHQGAIPTIFVMRQLPVNGLIINLLLGLSSIRHLDFLAGTAIGILPSAMAMTALGSGAVAMSEGRGTAWVAAAVAAMLLMWIVFTVLVRRSKAVANLRESPARDAS